MAKYQVVETFISINGEGCLAGELAAFIRFQGCNLNCSYCDTMWANEENAPSREMTEDEIFAYIRDQGVKNVTLTGGEPLLQKQIEVLLDRLHEDPSLKVEIETNGSVLLKNFRRDDRYPSFTMDYKLPGSGMEAHMCFENMELLQSCDTVKFVVGSIEDLKRAKTVMEQYHLLDRCHVYFSPVFGRIDPSEIVAFMIEHRLNGVRMQLQMHKFIWDPNKRGV